MGLTPVPSSMETYPLLPKEFGRQTNLLHERVPNICLGVVGGCCIGTGSLIMASGAILSVVGIVVSFKDVGTATGVAASVAGVAATISSLCIASIFVGSIVAVIWEKSIQSRSLNDELILGTGYMVASVGALTGALTASGAIIASSLIDEGGSLALTSSAATGGVLIGVGGLLAGSGSVFAGAGVVVEEVEARVVKQENAIIESGIVQDRA